MAFLVSDKQDVKNLVMYFKLQGNGGFICLIWAMSVYRMHLPLTRNFKFKPFNIKINLNNINYAEIHSLILKIVEINLNIHKK